MTIAILYLGLNALIESRSEALRQITGAFAIPSLLLVPAVGGLVCAWFWRSLQLRTGEKVAHSFWTTLIGIACSYFFMKEGVICLIMAYPILWAAIFAGLFAGGIWFRQDGSKLHLCIVPLAALVATGEMATRELQRDVVVDEMLIHAPPEKVWPHVLAFPEIPETPTYWLFRVGLPYPVATTNGGDHVGADRQCIFSNGLVIKEQIAEFLPAERLTFDIVEQPKDPEAYGHITLHRGRFELRDNHDGTTTLIGSSWYTLHTHPHTYFNWWVRDMTREVHLRVMRHVRQLSERPA